MENRKNKQILLASRPSAMPTVDNFKFVDTETPQLKDGEFLIRTQYLSVDPYMRGRMTDRKSYISPFTLNEMITGGAIGEVIESRSDAFQPADIITGHLGWQLYSVVNAKQALEASIRKIDPGIAPVTTALGILGMPGLTAYFGFLDIGRPKSGETVVVSGAAGAVGTVVCQIAKISGCRVVGIAGSDEKNEYLKSELGVDATINYKSSLDIGPAINGACPNGVDIYFDNVGGEVSDAVMTLINPRARVIICGQIALYNLEKPNVGPRIQPYLLINSALMQGFIITNYEARFGEGINQLGQWLAQGKLKYVENVVEGFENTPRAFMGLFTGENLGKQLVKVAD
jgi:NADPH-dependent curcumin reductase CurA